MALIDKLKKGWDAFRYSDENRHVVAPQGRGSSSDPQRIRTQFYSERSIVASIYTRMAIDVAGVEMRHVVLDDQKRYKADMDSGLNSCLTFEPNLDQGPRAFRQDLCEMLFYKGVAAIVPVHTDVNPVTSGKFDIFSFRVCEILEYYPSHVRLSVYNERTGDHEEMTVEKRICAIVQNPMHSVMNEPNSTLQRLTRKLQLLDIVDEQSSSGKLDMIIHLPYSIKTESKREQAEARREAIEIQMRGSKYGIAYADATEKITQLNRPAENNLLNQVTMLQALLYNQLGLTEKVVDGTADQQAMLYYFSRTVEPILDAAVEAMSRTFIGTSRAMKGERVKYFRDPFKLVPLSEIAAIADKFSRNEILAANEIRSFMGIAPSSDPKADKLINSNMPQVEPQVEGPDE